MPSTTYDLIHIQWYSNSWLFNYGFFPLLSTIKGREGCGPCKLFKSRCIYNEGESIQPLSVDADSYLEVNITRGTQSPCVYGFFMFCSSQQMYQGMFSSFMLCIYELDMIVGSSPVQWQYVGPLQLQHLTPFPILMNRFLFPC